MVAQEADGVLENDIYNDIPDNAEIDKTQSLNERIVNNAEVEIPEYRKQLLDAKEQMLSCANMYQQDYLDKVEERTVLATEAKEKAVLSLLDVSKRICNLAECFNKLIDDQAEKLQEIENLATTATASLETISCQKFRQDLSSRVPTANIPPRQHRIGRPESMQTDFFNENVVWEKLNYNKLDCVGAGGFEAEPEDEYVYNDVPPPSVQPPSKTPSQLSINSNTSSHVTSSLQSPTLSNARLTASSVDVTRDPISPGLNRYGSSSSINSSKSLRIMPARAAPAPPPNKAKAHRTRVYSVKNETGEGLDKPCIPPPPPPSSEDIHYATPPVRTMPTLSEEEARGATPTPNVIYEQTAPHIPAAPPAPAAPAPPPNQYQTIAVAGPPVANDDVYVDYDDALPPPPSDIIPPPLPAAGAGEDDYIYADTNSEIVSKDSGFYTEDQEEDDIIDKVEAIYPYVATANDELNLNIGDVVVVHVKNPDGWYEGTLNGVRGLFPGNYVQHVD